MTITTDSPIVGFVGGDFDWPANPKRPHDLADYFEELHRLCKLVDFDYRILVAQAWHESAGWSDASPWWPERLNCFGLGITGDPAQNAASPTFATGTDAARAHVYHMALYVLPPNATTTDPRWLAINQYAQSDPRRAAVRQAGFAGTVRTLGDLGNGKWAADENYAPQIAAKANQIFPEEAMPDIVYGNVPYPSVIQSHLPASNPMVETSGAPDVPLAVVWHRMLGTLLGTDQWFHAGHAATCYGIGCAATDGTANAGKIYEWIAPRTGWYGESSGPVSAPYGDGLALVNKVGVNSVNRVSKAIEISGNYDTPLDEACRAALVAMTAYWADQKRIPWDQFPMVPGEGRSFVVFHQELTIGTGKVCPGKVVMDETPALIERIRQYLKGYQVSAAPTPEPNKPSVPWGKDGIGIHKIGDTNALAFLGQVTAKRDVPVWDHAGKGAKKIGTIAKGKTATARGTFRSGNTRYVLIDLGDKGIGRASLSAFHEKWPVL
jgi:hypothetical protein